MLRKIGKINDISEKLRNEIPKFKSGEVKSFRSLEGYLDRFHEENGNVMPLMKFPRVAIPLHDFITDPYTGEIVEIGVPKIFNSTTGEVKEWYVLTPFVGEHRWGGKIALTERNGQDEEIFAYLWISNINGTNPHRYTKEPAKIEYVDTLKEAKEKRALIGKKRTALEIAKNYSLDDKKDLLAKTGVSTIGMEAEVIDMLVDEMADKQTELFLSMFSVPTTNYIATLKLAEDYEIIRFDQPTCRIYLKEKNQEVMIVQLDRRSDREWKQLFADMIDARENGEDKIFENIDKAVKRKRQQEEREAKKALESIG